MLATIVSGPVIGRLVALHPLRRSWLVLGITGLAAGLWAVVLALPSPAPIWLLVVLVVAIALGGPGSMIVGGFAATLVTILLIGVVLDVLSPGREFTPEAFRAAWAVQFPLWAIGVAGVLRTRRLARRRMAEEGVTVPPMREALRRRRS